MHIGASFPIGKKAIKEWIKTHINQQGLILDVGAGGGTYSDLLKDNNYIIDAVEVFEPTISHIVNKYRTIYCTDIKYFNFFQNYDLVIMGDVLEHLTIRDAQQVLEKILQHTKYVIVAVPFMFLQEPDQDNPLEEHQQDDLNFEVMKNRYPQLQLLLYFKTDQLMHYADSDDPCWVEYTYYIAKGALYNE